MTFPFLPVAIASTFLLLLILEWVFPLRTRKHSWARRLLTNGCLSSLVFIIGTFIIKPAGIGLSFWTSSRPFGILHLMEMPIFIQFILGFMLMDLTFYYWHRANHEIPLLWRFHNIHHIDQDLDVTTSFRFHFVEILYSTLFRIIQIVIIGVQPITYLIYELIFTCETIFHHSNMRLPIRVERVLNKIIVTPRMHGIHHSIIKDETNSNYSVIFRWWDYLHRTLNLNVPQQKVVIGVAGYAAPEDNNLLKLLIFPFNKQRKYWIFEDGSHPSKEGRARQAKRSYLAD